MQLGLNGKEVSPPIPSAGVFVASVVVAVIRNCCVLPNIPFAFKDFPSELATSPITFPPVLLVPKFFVPSCAGLLPPPLGFGELPPLPRQKHTLFVASHLKPLDVQQSCVGLAEAPVARSVKFTVPSVLKLVGDNSHKGVLL